jgi:hypothetical protein
MAGARNTALLGALWAGALLSACSSPTPSPTASPSNAAPTTAAVPTATPTPSPTPSQAPSPRATLASCPTTPAAASSLPVLWRGGHPDDLSATPGGSLWVSDVTAQLVHLISLSVPGGAVDRTITGLTTPDGVSGLANGAVAVGEQDRNRVTVVDTTVAGGARSVLLTLPSRGGLLGLDGITWDSTAADRLLIPDSPHGTLLSWSFSQKTSTTLATGLGRPVGVATGSGGDLWLAAENEAPRGLLHVVGGTATPVGHLAQLDDVVLDAGLLYATDLRTLTVHAIDPDSGADRVIASGFGEPQGLAVLGDGGLAIADSPRGVVQRITPCGA